MDDAISRSALVNGMKGVVFPEMQLGNAEMDSLYQSIKNLYSEIIYIVETEPAIDAVPVVRCEDCYWRSATGYCRRYGHSAPDGFFCADGKEAKFVDKSSGKKDEDYCGARMEGETE